MNDSKFLQVIVSGHQLAADVDLVKIAGMTDGYSGSDLHHLCTAAAMRTVRELLQVTAKGKPLRSKAKCIAGQHSSKKPHTNESDRHPVGKDAAAECSEHLPSAQSVSAASDNTDQTAPQNAAQSSLQNPQPPTNGNNSYVSNQCADVKSRGTTDADVLASVGPAALAGQKMDAAVEWMLRDARQMANEASSHVSKCDAFSLAV